MDFERLPINGGGFHASPGPLGIYLSEIKRLPLLSRKEEHDVACLAHGRDRTAAEKLAICNLRFVVKIALEYRSAGLEILDLIQEGNLGLLRAVKKYDPDKGAKFSVYASFWIRAFILKYIMDSWSMVKIGNTRGERKLFYRLTRDPEIPVQDLEIEQTEVQAIRQRLSQPDISLDDPLCAGSNDTEMCTIGACGNVEDIVSDNEEFRILSKMITDFRKTLSEREALVFDLRIIAEEPASLREMGNILGISHERVRQMEHAVLGKLNRRIEEERHAVGM
jgi:RNA polymerase sigma-32 factor